MTNPIQLNRDPLELLNELITEADNHLQTMKHDMAELQEQLTDLENSKGDEPAERKAWLVLKQSLLKTQIELYRGAIKQTGDLVAISLRHGLDERLVKLEEDKVQVVFAAFNRALSAIGISGDLRTTAERALANELSASAGDYKMIGD